MTGQQGVAGALYGISIIAAASRTAIKVRKRQPLQTDDIFLFLACACLTASTALIFKLLSSVFLAEANFVVLDPTSVQFPPNFVRSIVSYQREIYAFLSLSSGTIFSVKFSFLFFFRLLIDRLNGIVTYWKIVVVITIVCFIYSVISFLIACPHLGLSARM